MSGRNRSIRLITGNQRGALLIGLIVTITVLAVMMVSMMRMTTTATFNELFASRQERTHYLAEAGGTYAVNKILAAADASAVANGTYTLDTGNTFTLVIDDTSANYLYVHSEGILESGGWLEAKTKVTYRIDKPLSSSSSSVGDNGIIGTTIVMTKNKSEIEVLDSSPDTKVGFGALDNKGEITPPTAENPGVTEVPSVPAFNCPSIVSSPDFSSSPTLSGGTYSWEELSMGTDEVLNIDGDVTLCITRVPTNSKSGQVELGTDSEINIISGSLNIYVDGNDDGPTYDVSFGTRSKVNDLPGASRDNFTLYGRTAECNDIDLNNTGGFKGFIWAPEAHIIFRNGGDNEGTFWGETIDVKANSEIKIGKPGGFVTPPSTNTYIQYFSAQ